MNCCTNAVVTKLREVIFYEARSILCTLVFKLASAMAGSTVTITSVNFEAATGSQPATPYGDFTNGIAYNGQNGGGHGSHGPLEFFVFNANGITINDFVTNSGGYYFAAD